MKTFSQITDYRKGKIVFTPFCVLSWFLFAKKKNSNSFTEEENEEFAKWKYIAFKQIFSFSILFLTSRALFFILIFVPENYLMWVLLSLDVILVVVWVKVYEYSFSLKSFYIVSSGISLFLCFEPKQILGMVSLIAISIPNFFCDRFTLRQDNCYLIAQIIGRWSAVLIALVLINKEGDILIFLNYACFVIFYACIHSCIIKLYLNEMQPNNLNKYILNFGTILGLIIGVGVLIALMS